MSRFCHGDMTFQGEVACLRMAEVKATGGGSGNYSYHRPMCSHHPLPSACLDRSSRRVKVVDVVNFVEGPAGFKPDAWKYEV